MIGRTRLALIAGLTTLLLAAGSGAAYAWWMTSASVGSTATTASVGVTHALSASTLAVTYDNATSTTAAVGVVTVTNTGTRAGTYSLAISATSASATLRSAVKVEVGTAASCTTSAMLSGPTIGNFAATVTTTPAAIAAGASVVLCVRTSMLAGDITTNALTSLAATVASSITIGTWSATASPAITFTQTVAAAANTVDSAAWYWLGSVLNTAQCVEGLNFGTGSGTAVTIGACTAPSGSDANELFRFTPTSGGFYRVVYKAAPTLGLAANGNGNNKDIIVSTDTSNLAEWQVVFNADSTITLKYRNNTARCLTIPGGSTTAGTQLQIQNCIVGSTSQRFALTMYNTATPAPVVLTCSGDGFNAYYSWPALTGYEGEVVYRVYINGILVSPHSRGTGWDPTVQFGSGSITTAVYGSGSKPVLVQQNVSNVGWTTTGTGALVIANSAPFLLCG